MAGNSFGNIYRLSTFGESHGPALGGVIDGCPAGLVIDEDFIRLQLERRKPGQSKISTTRTETDEVEFLSGIFEGLSTGAPIGFMVRNKDHRSADYDAQKNVFRPGHADHTWLEKFGIRDHRGSGRASARETLARVVGGAVAQLFLKKLANVTITAFVSAVHDIEIDHNLSTLNLSEAENNIVRCPDPMAAEKMIARIEEKRSLGDSVGGVITCIVKKMPLGLGEPVFDKLPALLAHAMMSINAAKGFELGSGFSGSRKTGSEMNDQWTRKDGKVVQASNHAGGSSGGISNGEDLYFKVAFKPVSSIASQQSALNKDGDIQSLELLGRHDPCVVPRAVPIVEAMCALVLADLVLLNRTNKV